MATCIISAPPTPATGFQNQKKGTNVSVADALEAAKTSFVDRNQKSLQFHQEALKSLPGGNTRTLLHSAPFPVFLAQGDGYEVVTADGHTCTDFVGELTAGLYGHSQPLIKETLISTIQNIGLSLGGTTELEAQHASLICSRFNLDLVRFTNSGTEANLHAIQAAKRFTGKRKVVAFSGGYHGGCFMFEHGVPSANTVDRHEWIVAAYNDIGEAKSKIEESGDIAAVIVEGMQGHGPDIVGTNAFLHQIQISARKAGAVFILDEVMTSRLAPGGLQQLEGLQPDITTMGKYLGGGIAFGCFGGRDAIMRIYDPRDSKALAHSGTFNNNTLGMAAGYAGLSKVYTPEVARDFNAMGDRFRERLQQLGQGTKLTVTGRGSLIGLHFLADGRKDIYREEDRQDEIELRELFWFEMLERNFWCARRGNISLMLGTPWEELERFMRCLEDFMNRYEHLVKL